MGNILTCQIPLSKTICSECNTPSIQPSITAGNSNIIIERTGNNEDIHSSNFKVKVDVKRIKYKKQNDGTFSASAQLLVLCPKCDKPHEIEQVIDTPSICFENSKKCDVCGEFLKFEESSLEISDKKGKPFITISGKSYCPKCKKSVDEIIQSKPESVEECNDSLVLEAVGGRGRCSIQKSQLFTGGQQ